MAYNEADLDALTRMIVGEAGDQSPAGKAAVAHVALNRVNSGSFPGGTSLSGVIAAPWQFEGYNNRVRKLPANSPEYQSARSIAEGVANGTIPDPTGGAKNFIAPELQVHLGRKMPDWANQGGQRIGGHVFFGGNPPAVALAGAAGAANDMAGARTRGVSPAGTMAFAGEQPVAAQAGEDDDLFGRLINGKATAGKAAAPAAEDDDLFGRLINGKAAPPAADAKPAAKPGDDQGAMAAGAYSALRGVPVVGPFLDDRSTDLAAFLKSKLFGGGDQAEVRKGMVARENATMEAHPTASTVGGVAGGVLGTVPAMLAAPEAFGVGAGSLIARSGASMLTGGAISGADSLVRGGPEGETADQARDRVLRDTAVGAAFGGLAPGAGDVIGKLAGGVINAVTKGVAGSKAAGTLAGRVAETGTDQAAMEAEMAANPRLRPVDVNEGLLTTAQRLAARGGPEARAVIDRSVADTREGAAGAVEGSYNKIHGSGRPPQPGAITRALDEILEERGHMTVAEKSAAMNKMTKGDLTALGLEAQDRAARAATPLNGLAYVKRLQATTKANADAAFRPILAAAKPVDVTPVLQTIDNTLKPGLTAVASQGVNDLPLGADKAALKAIRATLTNGKQTVVDAERLHQIQYQLREWADRLAQSSTGTDRNTAAAIYKLREVLNNAIDDATPRVDPANPSKGGMFRAAQAQFKGDKDIEDAFEIGLNFWKNGSGMGAMETRPEAWQAWWQAASQEERDAVKAGIRDAVQNEKGRVNNEALKGETMARPTYNKQKLAIIFGKDEAEQLIRDLNDEAKIAGSNAKMVSGSKTAETTAADAAVADPNAKPKALQTLANIAGAAATVGGVALGHPFLGALGGAALAGGKKVVGDTAAAVTGRIAAKQNRLLAEALTNPQAFGKLFGAAQRAAKTKARIGAGGNLAVRDDKTRSAVGLGNRGVGDFTNRLMGASSQ